MKLRRYDVLDVFGDAERSIVETGARTLKAELDFIRSRHAWANDDVDVAELYAERAAAAGEDDRTSVAHLEHIRTFAINLQGLLAQDASGSTLLQYGSAKRSTRTIRLP